MAKIKATPEGRKGIYLVEKQDMVDWLIKYPEDSIHNYIPSSRIMFGADWDKSSVIDHLESAERIAILTGDAQKQNMNHALSVVSGNKLRIFDIGAITESDIELKPNQDKNALAIEI